MPYPRRLLMTADAVGGVWTYALELTKALAPFGTQVELATMGPLPTPAQRQQAAALPNLTLHESSYQLEWMDDPWTDVAAAGEWLLQLAADLQPDLIHLNGMVHGALPWQQPVVAVVHSCVLSWWRAVKGEAAPKGWNTYRTRVARGLQAANVVVAPTRAMLQEAEALYGPFQQGAVVHNGLAPGHFQPAPKEPFILGMGRVWDEAKNLSLLAQIAPALPWPVYLAGDARHPATGEVLTLPNVQFLGYLSAPEAASWLARAALYVLPARYEPFGLTLLEAALSGCALVTSKINTLTEIWADAACYVDPQNAQELQTILFNLIENEPLRRDMAKRANRRAARYTAAHMGQAYGSVYQNLLTKCLTPSASSKEEGETSF